MGVEDYRYEDEAAWRRDKAQYVNRQTEFAAVHAGIAGIFIVLQTRPWAALFAVLFLIASLLHIINARAAECDGLARRLEERVAGRTSIWNAAPEGVSTN